MGNFAKEIISYLPLLSVLCLLLRPAPHPPHPQYLATISTASKYFLTSQHQLFSCEFDTTGIDSAQLKLLKHNNFIIILYFIYIFMIYASKSSFLVSWFKLIQHEDTLFKNLIDLIFSVSPRCSSLNVLSSCSTKLFLFVFSLVGNPIQ